MDPYIGQIKDIVLGQDFLTWLWFKSETQNGLFRTENGEEFTLYMEQRISVQGGEGESLETAVVSGQLSELKEAKLGLATGKKVNRALIRVELDVESWQVTLKAEDLTLSSLRTPKIEAGKDQDDDPDAKFLEKIFLVERLTTFIDTVYAQFLKLRLGPKWPDELLALRQWLAKDR